ncbi:hypothetical protein AWB76_02463 [Caballeronia temeraria]|uniref:Uncharacterized protein n=1 Tax=Caballeronia temeraria TaxID=1777137 RepID=A0A158AI63_9BURK|nr:hypothetical protein [Caballeronia temeraria]SAK57508.1 hypothetical protein AWB76_02463 [Caballeronia temeraria]
MYESENKKFLDVAQEVMGEAHTPETITALAKHAAELVALRGSSAGAPDLVSIGTRISECLYLIKDAVVATAGDTLESRKEAAAMCFSFLAKAVEMPRSVARQYMRIAERFKDTDLDLSAMTVLDLLSRP